MFLICTVVKKIIILSSFCWRCCSPILKIFCRKGWGPTEEAQTFAGRIKGLIKLKNFIDLRGAEGSPRGGEVLRRLRVEGLPSVHPGVWDPRACSRPPRP